MNKPKIRLNFSMWVNCPYCDNDIDVLDQDIDNLFSEPLFNNDLDKVKDYDIYCDQCDEHFKNDGIEY